MLSFQAAGQTIVGCILATFASNIAASVGWKNWYLVYAGLSGGLLVLAFFFVPETKYERPLEAYNGLTATTPAARTEAIMEKEIEGAVQVTQANRPALDYNNFPKHTVASTLNLMPCKPDWAEMFGLYRHMVRLLGMSCVVTANSVL